MATREQQSDGGAARRLQTNDLELGVTEALETHVMRNVVHGRPVSQKKLDFEHRRPRWLREMAAEATGVFFYVYPGIAATASFILNQANPAFGSIFQVGWAYAIGIAFAIITCASTSGGHFNPAVTISLAVWQGFPWKKVPYYIFAQVFGAFIAGLILMGQYHEQISLFKELTLAQGKTLIGPTAPAGILTPFPLPNQTYGYLFFIEWFVCSFIGLVIWTCLDPAQPFVAPAGVPFVIGLAYATMIWGFADVTISTNMARDLGTRFVAAIFYGRGAFPKYSAISILVNIPATLVATAFYEIVLRDSLTNIAKGHARHEHGEEGLTRHLTKTGTLPDGGDNTLRNRNGYINGSDESGVYTSKKV